MARVLLDARVERGGIGRYARGLIEWIPRVSSFEPVPFVTAASGTARAARLPFTPWGRVAMARAARTKQVGLVHGLHLEAPPRSGVPVVLTIHDLIPLEFPDSMPGRLRRRVFSHLIASGIRRATALIVPSERTKSALACRGLDATSLSVIPIGVDGAFGALAPEERAAAVERFGAGREYVAAVTTAKAHKNLSGLLAAGAALPDPVRIVCVGTEPPAGSPPTVSWIGPLSDPELRLLYGGATALVLPSFIEGYGLPALEAAACGTPVICGDNVGVLPHIRPGAVVVDVSRPRDIADAVVKLAHDPGLRDELGAAAAEAASPLTMERTAAATVAVYEDALRK